MGARIAYLIMGLGVLIALSAFFSSRTEQVETIARNALFEACERGNLARGQQLRDDLDSGDTLKYAQDQTINPILDCWRTVYDNDGVEIPMTREDQRAYVDVLSEGRRPEVTYDPVVIK